MDLYECILIVPNLKLTATQYDEILAGVDKLCDECRHAI